MNRTDVDLANFYCLLHPYPTFLVTCMGPSGERNIITIAWLIPVSVAPPLLVLAVRPTRHSHDLITGSGEFVVNVVGSELARESLFCGRRSGRDLDKFAATGLTAAPAQVVAAPLIAEALAHVECRLVEQVTAGDHTLFIAEVVAARATPDFLRDGLRDLEAAPPLLHVGGDRFATTASEVIEPESE